MQVNTSQIVRIRTDFSLSPIPSNLAKDISQNLNQTRRFSIRTCSKLVSVSLLQYIVLSCAIRAQKPEHVSTKMFWRRNKLMSYSMIIDIYYPIELNWIECFFKSSFQLPDNIFQNFQYQWEVVICSNTLSTHRQVCMQNVCFIVRIWHFSFIMRISVSTFNLHHVPIKEQLTSY